MNAITTTRAVLARIFSWPGGFVGVAILLSAWPVALALSPTGIASSAALPIEWSYELAFIGGAVGILAGLSALTRLAPVLTRQPVGGRLGSEWFALNLCGWSGAGLTLVPAVVCRIGPMGGEASLLMLRILPALMAISAAGSALARIRPLSGTAPWLLASGLLLSTMIHAEAILPHSLVVMAAGFLLTAWLLDEAPFHERFGATDRARGDAR